MPEFRSGRKIVQDFTRLAKALRCKGTQNTDQSRPDQRNLALAQPKTFDRPDLQSQQPAKQRRKSSLLFILPDLVHSARLRGVRRTPEENSANLLLARVGR